MTKPLLLIISGPPCTGKTTLGKSLAQEFHLPFINKDGFKEILFDRLGWSDRAWSKKLGVASMDILYSVLEAQLRAEQSCIVESNFRPEFDTQRFLELKEVYNFEPFQIQCTCDGPTLLQRFKQRAESSSSRRHPGHGDQLNYEEFTPGLLKGRLSPLEIGGTLYEVDTTDFRSLDYKKIIDTIMDVTK